MQRILHETCQQYIARRLSEGWRIIRQEGFEVILQSPEGITRPVDIRNDIETLRPSAPGDWTGLFPVRAPTNWECVDETPPDEEDTYVCVDPSGWDYDVYKLPAHSVGSGTINFIKVYFRCFSESGACTAYPKIKTGGSVYTGDYEEPTDSWVTYSHQWTTNPKTKVAWIWDDIDALQIGVELEEYGGEGEVLCTQVYVEVDYTAVAGWTGKISGVTNPAKIMGVDVANIAKVKGVA